MMGTGKTTVGALVAERLGRPFVDLDTEIMEHTGRTIPGLFAASEERFREAESTVLALLAGADPSVYSTGGGSVARPTNVEVMKRTGTLVLLTASVETIVARIGDDPMRPLAREPRSLADLASDREAIYDEAADHVIDTEGKEPGTVAEEVLACSGM